jgi:hypothetical protein
MNMRTKSDNTLILGIAFPKEDTLVVDDIIARSPAGRAGVRKGDVLLSIGRASIQRREEIPEHLRRSVVVRFRRGRTEKSFTVKPVNLSRIKEIIPLLFGDDEDRRDGFRKECDEATCKCVSANNAFCTITYRSKGRGPRGGILYLKHCSSYNLITKQSQDFDDLVGPKEFF